MEDITIVNGDYKPTNISRGHHLELIIIDDYYGLSLTNIVTIIISNNNDHH